MPPASVVKVDLDPTMFRDLAQRAVAQNAPQRGVLGRLVDRLRGVWMGPGVQIDLVAPPGTEPRSWDYPVSINTQVQPRAEEAISFLELRSFSRQCTIARLAIETVKDRMAKYGWSIQYRDRTVPKDKIKSDPRIPAITQRLRKPDGVLPFGQWLRKTIEEVLVPDALAIYLRPDAATGEGTSRLEVLAGDTIRPLIDETGRPPETGAAFRQVLKGVPAVDFTRERLIYAVRNPTASSLYGFSPLEQVILTVNIAIRREISQLEWFTSGTLPDAVKEVPEAWTTTQIRDFEQWWYTKFSGPARLAQQRRLHFVPPGAMHELRGKPLQDEFDEWLARVISWAFNLSPQWAAKMMNRGTAETAQEVSTDEGTIPMMLFLKEVFDTILEVAWGAEDLEFRWQDVREDDPLVLAEVNERMVRIGAKSVDEWRAEAGLDPIGFPHAVFLPDRVVFVKDLPQLAQLELEQAGLSLEATQRLIDNPPPVDGEVVDEEDDDGGSKPPPPGGRRALPAPADAADDDETDDDAAERADREDAGTATEDDDDVAEAKQKRAQEQARRLLRHLGLPVPPSGPTVTRARRGRLTVAGLPRVKKNSWQGPSGRVGKRRAPRPGSRG